MNAMLLESEVHSYLRDFWRAKSQPHWQHHLTMARLVARALRLGRSALIQTGSSVKRYCYSYITPALLGNSPVLIVAPLSVQKQLQEIAIPQLQQWLATNKSIIKESALVFPSSSFWENFDGIMLIEPQTWLRARLNNQGGFPGHIPTLIDGADAAPEV